LVDEQTNTSYQFGPFRLLPAERQLLRDNQTIALPPKAFGTLVILVQNHGHAMKKDDLMRQVWPDAFVEESNLNHNISVLRKALSDGQNGESYVETVRGYGFRFKANVLTQVEEDHSVLVHKRTRTHVVFTEEESQSQKSTTVIQTRATGSRVITASVLVLICLALGVSVSYFGFARPSGAGNTKPTTVPSAVGPKKIENPAVREAYLKGRYFWNQRNPDAIFKAQRLFQTALESDPNYAPAYVGLADCLMTGGAIPGLQESSKSLALKALAIDPSLAEAHATLAYYMSAIDWDWYGAEIEFQKAISLDPAYASARHWHAYNLASLGRLEEALSEIRKAEEAEPLSVIIKTDVGHILYFARRNDEAIAQYLKALQLNPEFRVAHWRLGEALIQVGKYDEAVSHLHKAIDLAGTRISDMEAWIGYAKAVSNDRQDALRILNRLKPEAEFRSWFYYIATIYAGLGDKDAAFAWLDKSLARREGSVAVIKVEPMLDNLRDDPRFSDILRRMNLP
jgi:DNA-binding winged helix-turn-helix (wHTH) protein/tetratricopeptide (TPR) repeat protein